MSSYLEVEKGEEAALGLGDSSSASDESGDEVGQAARPQAGFLGLSTAQLVALGLWLVYLAVALVLRPSRVWGLALFTALCLGGYVGSQTGAISSAARSLPAAPPSARKAVLGVLVIVAGVVVAQQLLQRENVGLKLQALLGTGMFVLLCVGMSMQRSRIPWDVVIAGCLVQFFFGCLVMRSKAGVQFFETLGDAVTKFLDFSDVGAQFVFGKDFKKLFFACKVLPTTIFFSAFISAMYYLGVMQVIIRGIALFLKKTIGTSLVQSVNAAGNLFLGQTEAPLLIRPFLAKATPCDIHCVMVGGFASIAGGVLAAYIGMGVSASQLIGASLMSVPGTLFVSNMVCPPGSMEDKEDKPSNAPEGAEQELVEGEEVQGDDDHFEFQAATENNIVEAAGNGAHIAIDLVLNIGAMLIAFMSLIAAFDFMLKELGENVGVPLSFDMICGYLFWPFAWLLGTPFDDCFAVANLIGNKIIVNEFVAYSKLGEMISDPDKRGISQRGELVATYALCGFSNIGSIGIQLGGLSVLAPERKGDIAKLVVPAMIAGNIVCFLTASFASVLH